MGRPCVMLYRGFGANAKVFIEGRALLDRRIAAADAASSRLANLWAMLRRAHAHGIAHSKVRVTIGPLSQDFETDDEGFFSGWMAAVNPHRLDEEWIDVEGELVATQHSARSTGRAWY